MRLRKRRHIISSSEWHNVDGIYVSTITIEEFHLCYRLSYVSVIIAIKVHFLNYITMKVQKVSFQNQAGEALLEKGGSASVHHYVHANRTFQVRFRCDAEYAT